VSDCKAIGNRGEELAAEYLKNEGYELLERNYHSGKAEIDIIAKKDETLAVVEVKTRSTSDFGRPADFVKPTQIRNLMKAVNAYVETIDFHGEIRFDIISVEMTENSSTVSHLENAFYHFNA